MLRCAAMFGRLALPLNRAQVGGTPVNFMPHNVREGFHALAALARYRDSAAAREQAEASIAAILALWDPEQGWDVARLEQAGIAIERAELTMVPQTTVPAEGDEARRLLTLLEDLEENDDVQQVYANFDISDEVLEEMAA